MALQLVEVRADLDLILCAALQISQSQAVVGRGLHVLHRPGAADGPVEDAVSLDVAGLMGNLDKMLAGQNLHE